MRQTQDTQKRSNLKSFIIIGLLLLLVAVIGFGGYTLSKYLTSQPASGTANVAKWGFEIKTDATKLFGTNYKWDGTASNSIVEAGSEGLTVKAANNAVAPGTTGSLTFSIKGSAEVKAQIKIAMTEVKDINLNYNNSDGTATDYYPVKWTLIKKGTTTETLVNDGKLSEVETALNKTADYEAGATAINDEYTLSWTWAFSTNDDNDILDTTLGMIANGTTAVDSKINNTTVDITKSSTEIAFKLEISVTQLAQ